MVTILSIGAIQALFFSMLLFTKNVRTLSDKILQYWLLVLFLHISANLLEFMGYYQKYPHLIGSSSSLVFLYGPLLYFYTRTYVSDSFKFRKVHLLHLIPFLVYNLALLPFYTQSADYKLYYYNEVLTRNPPPEIVVSLVAKTLSIPVYLIWILVLLRKHRKNITRYFSNLEKVDLRWLQYLVWSMVAVTAFILGSAVVKVRTNFVNAFHTEQYIFSAATLWVLGLGYYGLRQTPVFTDVSQTDQPKNTTATSPRSNMDLTEVEQYKESLFKYMEQEQPYLQSKLTLNQLADEVKIPAHMLSQLLNGAMDQNFFHFINHYRVEEVKKRLQNPKYKNLTILGIALECGFSSKAAFNRIFKLHTGVTPSEYLKNQKA
jgi:AraC-like DNA-binding protein